MSNIDNPPEDITPEQINAGLDKFLTIIEEEIELHHSHPEWMDFDKRCREESNLIVRSDIILDMLEEVMSIFQLNDDNRFVRRFKIAKLYFNNII
tara:strand:- start:159286 stop:159570 length:285 start_codon:yes stop_codon:yes gene_type:complete